MRTLNAATMCVPDLSTCESCSDFTYEGMKWSANCCGVQVHGIVFAGYFSTHSVPKSTRLQDVNVENTDVVGVTYCLITSPFIAQYAVTSYCTIIGSEGFRANSYTCAWFHPSCAVGYCDGTFKCEK